MTVLRESGIRRMDGSAREFLVMLALTLVAVGAAFGISRLVDNGSAAAPNISSSESYFVPVTPRPTDRYSAPGTTLPLTDRYTASE